MTWHPPHYWKVGGAPVDDVIAIRPRHPVVDGHLLVSPHAHVADVGAHGLILEMLAGPGPGLYDPAGSGRMLFAFFAAMGETTLVD
jgi:hypothetical protein